LAKRKPAWKDVENRDGRSEASSGKRSSSKGSKGSKRSKGSRRPERRRLRVVYDVNGPRVRLGVGWFILNVAALIGGRWAVAVLYSLTAAIAALQSAKTWRVGGRRPHRIAAGAGAGAISIAGAFTTETVGAVILGVVAVALFLGYAGRARDPRADPILDASFTIRCALFAGFAAACVSIAARFEFSSVVGLVFIVAAYETGDFLVGSGASNSVEGPVAGGTAIVVTTFAIAALGIKPFEFPNAFLFGGIAAVLCPAGQLLASAILPAADAPASALRRIDSLLLLAPVWALVVGFLI
jgi:hypothetical protein